MPHFDRTRRLAAEALGTGFLVAAVVGSGIMAAKLAGGNGAIALLCNTIPTGAVLYVIITIFGPLSGAHFNPAVSLVMMLRGNLDRSTALAYIIAQIIGGCLGTLAAHFMFDMSTLQLSATARTGLPHGSPSSLRLSDCSRRSSAAYASIRAQSGWLSVST